MNVVNRVRGAKMVKQQRKFVRAELFSDLDDLIRELAKLHRIVGTQLVVDPDKVRELKNTSNRSSAQRRRVGARRLLA
jgi:hypothetical protein